MKIKIFIPAASFLLLAFAVWLAPDPDPAPAPPDVQASQEGFRSPAPSASPSPSVPPSPEEPPWNLTLVNAEHPLPGDFSLETAQLPNGLEFDSRAYGALTAMLAAGEAEGLSFVVCSAYRTVEYQRTLFDNQVKRYQARGYSRQKAGELTAREIMPPGTSEHNLGLAADIVSLSYQILDEAQADTAEQKWLMEHCWEYGFILRYPADKQELTGIVYEPWHYRYVGLEAARAIRESGQCLEEYLGA